MVLENKRYLIIFTVFQTYEQGKNETTFNFYWKIAHCEPDANSDDTFLTVSSVPGAELISSNSVESLGLKALSDKLYLSIPITLVIRTPGQTTQTCEPTYMLSLRFSNQFLILVN